MAIGSQNTSDQVEVYRKQARTPVMMIVTTYAVDTHFLMSRDRHVCRTGFGRVGGRTHGSIRHALPLLARQEALRWRWQVAHRSAPFLSMFVVLSICPRMLMVKLDGGPTTFAWTRLRGTTAFAADDRQVDVASAQNVMHALFVLTSASHGKVCTRTQV